MCGVMSFAAVFLNAFILCLWTKNINLNSSLAVDSNIHSRTSSNL